MAGRNVELSLIDKDNFVAALKGRNRPWHRDYLAMYSSQWDGITLDPDLMVVPADDHLVHRGDGVFEVIRCIRGRMYQLEAHLDRLDASASAISLACPFGRDDLRELVLRAVKAGGEMECLVRIVLSRGPGSFTANPYDCPETQVYINVIRYHPLPETLYRKGIPIVTSKIPIKSSYFANIKSCNYLPNVLMKMEAIQAGCPYSVALDENGFLAEGSNENVGVLTNEGVVQFPSVDRTLSGITAGRVFELAQTLTIQGMIQGVRFHKIHRGEAYRAAEMFFTGTSINVLPVVSYDGIKVGRGMPGPVCARLSSMLWEDMTLNGGLLTEVPWQSNGSASPGRRPGSDVPT
jgi:branched-chain amino acid aminotransferase